MKKILIYFCIIICLFITNFISASEENSFNGGDGSYLISQTTGSIENSPFRYEEGNKIIPFGITGKTISGVKGSIIWFVIPIALIIILITICLCKKEKIKKLFLFKKKREDED